MSEIELNRLYNENCMDTLSKMEDNSISSLIFDPPYELKFMNKKWDGTGIAYDVELWKECFRVIKPGGYMLCFSGTRTYHRMVCSIEEANFEIKDMIQFLYFTGFPKALDVSKAIDKKLGMEREIIGRNQNIRENCDKSNTLYESGTVGKTDYITRPASELAIYHEGWKSQLKPSHEPICLSQKPISEKTIVDNVLRWGTGALNIGETRIPIRDEIKTRTAKRQSSKFQGEIYSEWNEGALEGKEIITTANPQGRYPSNSITLENEQFYSPYFNITPSELSKKASKKDRNSKWNGMEMDTDIEKVANSNFGSGGFSRPKKGEEDRKVKPTKNYHPCVKSLDLMEWLLKLVTPYSGTVYDGFAGSGSLLVSAKRLQRTNPKYKELKWIGSELEPEYYKIAMARLKD